MDYSRIEQLLDRYWEAQTTLDEERELRRFFTEEEVPQHLQRYASLFAYQDLMQSSLSDDFDDRVTKRLSRVVVAKRRSPLMGLVPFAKAAAAIAAVLLLGSLAGETLYSEPMGDVTVSVADTIGQQTNAPSMAKGDEALIKSDADSLQQQQQPAKPLDINK